jgi:hypothetical protein
MPDVSGLLKNGMIGILKNWFYFRELTDAATTLMTSAKPEIHTGRGDFWVVVTGIVVVSGWALRVAERSTVSPFPGYVSIVPV